MTATAAAARGLVARTVPLDGDVDLLAVAGDDGLLFQREGAGLAGRGVAARIAVAPGTSPSELAEIVTATLAAIDSDDAVGRPGTGPIAIGALPFDPGQPGELIVPATTVGRAADGTAWVTHIGSSGAPAPALTLVGPRAAGRPPD